MKGIQEFRDFLMNCRNPFPVSYTSKIAREAYNICDVTRYKKVDYIECPCSFDIESSSFYDDYGNKQATMYVWVFGIFGRVILGRTWDDFVKVCEIISLEMQLSLEHRLVVYVHNLDFDFQFFRKWLEWDKVFSIDERKPVYAISTLGIEFRCSYKLSGYSLDTLGKNLQMFKLRKKTGDLDYNIPRHYRTPLYKKDIGYVTNDARVVMAYIMELMIKEGTITTIPITKTGFVRRYMRQQCFGETKESKKEYQDFIRNLRLTVNEYHQLKRAFQGGYTHANPLWVNHTVEDAESRDFTSSYPAVIVAEKFPMSSGQTVNITSMKQFEYNLKNYCCLFDVEFFNIESTFIFDNYISSSRCYKLEGEVLSNGRVVKASHLITTITEQDYFIIRKIYRWDGNPRIGIFRRYIRDYLPTPFVRGVLELYKDKTELKDIPERIEEYNNKKELINSCFGMCVTDLVREEIEYNDNRWKSEEPEYVKSKVIPKDIVIETIKKYNNSYSRFLFYPWGVWITAYARRNLWTAILECKEDHLYSDTDSEKFLNPEKHYPYFESYNKIIMDDLLKACSHHGINSDMIVPKTIKGIPKPLGVWDFDGRYSRFRTIGAKRYLIEYSDDDRNKKKNRGEIILTVAGLNKTKAIPYLIKKYGVKGVFENFNFNLTVPSKYTGKLTHTYIDRETITNFTDIYGRTIEVYEKSCIHLEQASYSLDVSQKFVDYIKSLRRVDYVD